MFWLLLLLFGVTLGIALAGHVFWNVMLKGGKNDCSTQWESANSTFL